MTLPTRGLFTLSMLPDELLNLILVAFNPFAHHLPVYPTTIRRGHGAIAIGAEWAAKGMSLAYLEIHMYNIIICY